MTREKIINTLRKLGIRTEEELELNGTLGLELEPNGNKILFLNDTQIGSLYKENDNYKIEIDPCMLFINKDIDKQLKDLASIATCENFESLQYIYNKTKMYLNNIETFIKYYKENNNE
jgi:hypothetical protein